MDTSLIPVPLTVAGRWSAVPASYQDLWRNTVNDGQLQSVALRTVEATYCVIFCGAIAFQDGTVELGWGVGVVAEIGVGPGLRESIPEEERSTSIRSQHRLHATAGPITLGASSRTDRGAPGGWTPAGSATRSPMRVGGGYTYLWTKRFDLRKFF